MQDDGFFADWKKWLVAWELRAAEFSAAELAGEIDYLQSKDLSDDGGPRKEELPGGELWATWRRLGGTLRSRAGLPWRKAKEGSDLRQPGRKIAIITTASLPWMTGTAVNPLLRTVFLAKDSTREVTLLVPWLSKADQATIFPSITFETPEEQETYVREWAKKRTGVEANFKIRFYPGRYAPEKGSILPIGDLTKYIPDEEADVAVLEEPEHLNWYHHGSCWTRKFSHVVGVVHTNYLDYARREEGGDVKQRLLKAINCWVCQAHCHKVVKLSGAVQPLPKEHTEFVHGVSPAFLEVGMAKRLPTKGSDERFSRGFYYIGKVVWGKGYTELLDMVEFHKTSTGKDLPVDVFGGGADFADVTQTSSTKGLSLMFHGPKDHLSPDIHEYKAFINPSTSDVVATTSAEALAMGKFVICCEHPSNKFFSQFRNCLVYRTPEEFNERVRYAMEHEPAPLSEEETFKLTWEAATERFLDIASLSVQERNPGLLNRAMDSIAYMSHNTLTGLEPVRVTAGAGVGTRDNPECVTGYSPSSGCAGGLFDRRVTESKQCT
uniref:Digalactosyldiacylglycerol synthase n=1 Tax=Tetraselmis sp. GSL018 TaxID=582737 RepID=A0A061RNI4_9CHLO